MNLWAFMRCRCMSPLGIVRGRIGRQVSLSVGLVRSCRGLLRGHLRSFTNVHRRWGQHWGQNDLALLFPPDIGKKSRSCTHLILDQPSMECYHELASCSPPFGMASCLASYGILQQAHMLLYSPGCEHLWNGVCMGLPLSDQQMKESKYGQ